MSAPPAPTERQLRYLRSLASRTATTFAKPRTRREASVEIDRLLALASSDAVPREEGEWRDGEQTEYATAVRADEVTGFGSSASWCSHPKLQPRFERAVDRSPVRPVRLRSYRVSAGRRVLIAERTGDEISITDIPADGEGISYPVDQMSAREGLAALRALLDDYLKRAIDLDEIPMAPGALEHMLGCGIAR